MLYFAYGSNMDSKRMKERGLKFSSKKRAILKGYRLEFNKVASCNPDEGYANIVKNENEIVEGVLYDIPETALSILDRCEGYPDHYQRITIRVFVNDNQDVDAVTYIANPNKLREGLKPSKEYFEYVLRGSRMLSEDYRKKLKSFLTR